MPVVLLDRLPLPNVRVYTAASVFALSGCVYFAQQTVSKGAAQDEMDRDNATQDVATVAQKLAMMYDVMVREPMCVWVSFSKSKHFVLHLFCCCCCCFVKLAVIRKMLL